MITATSELEFELVQEIRTHRAAGGPHTWTAVPASESEPWRWKALVGPVTDSIFDLWVADRPAEWRPHPTNTGVTMPWRRWPSIVRDGDRYVAAVRRTIDHTSPSAFRPHIVTNRGLHTLDRAYRYGTRRNPTAIELYESDDAETFANQVRVASPADNGDRFNQNPYLTTIDDEYLLTWYSGDGRRWRINYRRASLPARLRDAATNTILETDSVLAAPAVYEDDDSWVHLFTEEINGDAWITTHRSAPSIDALRDASSSVVFANDQACASPFKIDGDVYLWVARRSKTGLFERWVGEIYLVSL